LRGIVTPLRVLLSALALGTVLATGCAAHGSTANANLCYSFGVQAVEQRVTVTSTPAPCAGLSQEQVNESVSRAIRSAVRGLPKAAARRLADADSRYLAYLVRPITAGRPASATIAPARRASVVAARLAALAAWIVTAAAGAYLLAGLLGSRRPWQWRPDALTAGHAGLALTGLAVWIAYVVTVAPALSWIALGITFVIAGLGMATLLSGPSDPGDVPAPAASPTPPPVPEAPAGLTDAGVAAPARLAAAPQAARGGSRAPAYAIAAHGALATLTILLVLLAAIGAG
jgi:hypothetical protein